MLQIDLKEIKAVDLLQEEAIKFAMWLMHEDNGITHYNPYTKEETPSIGFSPWDCWIDKIKTPEELYKLYKEQKK